jgi:hypothetical protein
VVAWFGTTLNFLLSAITALILRCVPLRGTVVAASKENGIYYMRAHGRGGTLSEMQHVGGGKYTYYM